MSIYIEGVSTIEDMEKILEHMLNPNKTSQEKVFKNIPMKSAECTRCKKGHMVVRNGKHGIFAGCSTYPSCTNSMNLDDLRYLLLKKCGFNMYSWESKCWCCGSSITIFSYFPLLDESDLGKLIDFKENFYLGRFPKLDQYLEKEYPTLQKRYSNYGKVSYVANVCPRCNQIQGMNLTFPDIYNALSSMPLEKRKKHVVAKIPVANYISKREWINSLTSNLEDDDA